MALFCVPASAQQDLIFTPFHANGIYQPGDKLGAEHGLVYLDDYSAMVDNHGGMRREFRGDGVHPNPTGYALMGNLAEKAISAALSTSR